MQLDELKQNMSLLEQVLSKSSVEITINVSASETAKNKLLVKYRQAVINNFILAVVFGCLWIGNVTPDKLPNFFKAFISIMAIVASGWYVFLFFKLKSVNIAGETPARLFSETTRIKIFTLSGEIFFGLVLGVFFTLLLSWLFVLNPLAFKLIIVTLVFGLVLGVIYVWPQYMKLFRDLNSIK